MITYKISPSQHNRYVMHATGEGELSLDIQSLMPKNDNTSTISSIQLMNISWQTQNTISVWLGTGQPMKLYVSGQYDYTNHPELYFSQPTANNLNLEMINAGRCVVEYVINP